MKRIIFITFLQYYIFLGLAAVHNPFVDLNSYQIQWRPFSEDTLKNIHLSEYSGPIPLVSHANESFDCFVPLPVPPTAYEDDIQAAWKSGLETLQPLFKNHVCVLLLDFYWTYKLCHGNEVVQFHQEKDTKKAQTLITAEYSLGKYKPAHADAQKSDNRSWRKKIPTTNVGGTEEPYFELEMLGGTPCDILDGTPRKTVVRYVCLPGGQEGMVSITETSSCSYEALVASDLLCQSPYFRPRKIPVKDIQCISKSQDSPLPKSHSDLFVGLSDTKRKTLPREEDYEADEDISENQEDSSYRPQSGSSTFPEHVHTETDELRQALLNFLLGKFCVFGGGGYWKFKFCYGKTVTQFHTDKDPETGEKLDVVNLLGIWDPSDHMNWIQKYPNLKPLFTDQQKRVWYRYSNGDRCDLTGKARDTLVKLRCVKLQGTGDSAVGVTLQEPRPCSYILTVESAMFCHLAEFIDKDTGLPKEDLANSV